MKKSRFDEAAAVFEKLLRLDPMDEPSARQLMICYARTGRRSQALRTYRQLLQVLDRELGCGPEPETVAFLKNFAKTRAGKHLGKPPPLSR